MLAPREIAVIESAELGEARRRAHAEREEAAEVIGKVSRVVLHRDGEGAGGREVVERQVIVRRLSPSEAARVELRHVLVHEARVAQVLYVEDLQLKVAVEAILIAIEADRQKMRLVERM